MHPAYPYTVLATATLAGSGDAPEATVALFPQRATGQYKIEILIAGDEPETRALWDAVSDALREDLSHVTLTATLARHFDVDESRIEIVWDSTHADVRVIE